MRSNLRTVLILASAAGLAHATTYYVSTSGSDSNPGTASAPFRHVSVGAAAAHAGDTVIVMNGTYDNEGKVADPNNVGAVVTMTNSGSPGAPITIEAQNRGGAILNAASSVQSSLGCYGAWSYFDLSYVSYVTIQGFVLENSCLNGVRANGTAHDLIIRWNEIRNIGNWNNPATTLSPSGMFANRNEYNITFDGNVFHDIGGGTNVNMQHALYIDASNVTIVNNVFYNQVHGWDITLGGAKNVHIANNTFAFQNPNRQGHIILWDAGITDALQNVVIEDNIFYQPQTYAVVTELDGGGSIGGCSISYNLTTAGTTYDNRSNCSQTANAVNTNPNFVNASSAPYDFHLQAGSPAIGTGTNDTYTTVDIDGAGRATNGSYDMGAYVYQAAGTTPPPPPTSASISLAASPASVSYVEGGSSSTSIVMTMTGSADPTFSVSGLPSGVTASFSPASCTGPCTTVLHIGSSSSYQGTATLTVTAAGGSNSASTTLSLQVLPPPSTTGNFTSGLAADWKLYGNALDWIPGGNGSLHGGANWSNAVLEGAAIRCLSLNGTSGYMSAPETQNIEMTNQLTVAFWVYATPSPNADTSQRLVAKVYDWEVKLNGNHPQFSGSSDYAMMNYSLPLYTWTQIAFSYSSGAVTAYVNGQPVSLAANTFTSGTALPSYQYGVYIGTDSAQSAFFAGSMSDVRLYNRPLSAADVSALYNAGATVIH